MNNFDHAKSLERLEPLALGALSAEEREAVLAHVATCAECSAELRSLEEAAAMLALAVTAPPLDDVTRRRMRARLVARAGAAHGETARGSAAAARPGRGRRKAPWLAAAAMLVAAVSLAAWLNARREVSRMQSAFTAALSRRTEELAMVRRDVEARDRLLAGLTGPSVRVMELTSAGQRAPGARMFWDVANNRWAMFAHDIPQPAAGRVYQLWIVTRAGAKISAGTFAPSRNGTVVIQATYPLARDSLQAIAVTDEPEGGVPQPTGPVVIAASAGR